MTKEDGRIRTFIAIPIANQIKGFLEDISGKLTPKDGKGISRVRTEAIHLTVVFLGLTDKAAIERIKTILSQVTKDLKSFGLKSSGFKYLPSRHKMRTVTIGLEDSIELTELYNRIVESLSELEIDFTAQREYTPHLTLFRTKSKGASTTLLKSIDSFIEDSKQNHSKLMQLRFKIEEVVLYKSTLTENGAIHEPLGIYKLKK